MEINELIQGLTWAQEYIEYMSHSTDHEKELIDIIKAAKEYIVNEQPRILRYRELPSLILDSNTVVYVEHKGDKEYPLYTLVTACTVSSVTLCDGFCEEQEMEREDYNKTWRCWNKIPSPVQRKEPWDCDMD